MKPISPPEDTSATSSHEVDSELLASNARFYSLFQNMTLGVVYQEVDGRISLANPAAERMLGLTLAQMQGRTSHDPRWRAVREDGSDFPGEEHPSMVALRTGQTVTDVVMGVYHPDQQQTRWLRVAAVPEFHPGETQPFRVFATFDDITDRRLAEQRLTDSDRRFRQGLRVIGAVPYTLDYASGQFDIDLDDFSRLTGVPVHQISANLNSEIVLESRPRGQFAGQSLNEAVRLIRQGGHGVHWQCDHRIQLPDGSERWISDDSLQIVDDEGIPIGSTGIMQDITERKLAEHALLASEERYRQLAAELEQRVQDRTAELLAQRDFARQVMDALGQGLVVGDIEGRATYANLAMARLMETDQASLLGARLNDYTHPDDLAFLHSQFPERGAGETFQFELRMVSAAGTVKHVLISSSPLRVDGAVIGRIGVFTDLTAFKAIENNMRQSRDELSAANLSLERALRMKDEFLASMSHELRTPLTGILGMTEALQMQTYGPLNERQMRSLETVWESGRHLLALINDILDLSKLAASQLELVVEMCDVGDICHSSLALVKGMANKKHQQLTLEISQPSMTLRADPRRLKQMLTNLLSNAVKFTPEGGRFGLRVVGDAVQQVVEFQVWDEGIGIAAENLPRIFEPFTQLDSRLAREYAGTGLGLALVQRMVHLHGGEISVESAPGQGSTFTLTLPWRGGHEKDSHEEATAHVITMPSTHDGAPPVNETAAHTGSGRTILLAEDDSANGEMVATFLSAHGYQIELAHNGVEVMQRVFSSPPDLILMDIRMPQLDGLQAIRAIRASADPVVAAAPIIALTAQAMYGDAERCLSAGANGYISKPYRLTDLLQVIERSLLTPAADAPAAEQKR